jgi:UrcA family protein
MRKMLFAASLLSFAAATPAFAVETIRIPYSPTDVADTAGTAALYDKVVDAANTICKQEIGQNSLPLGTGASVMHDCVLDSVGAAVRRSREPSLTSYHKAALAAKKAGSVSATLAMR